MPDGIERNLEQDGERGAPSPEAAALAEAALRETIGNMRSLIAGVDLRGDMREDGTGGAKAVAAWLEASLACAPRSSGGNSDEAMREASAALRQAVTDPRLLAASALTMIDAHRNLARRVSKAAKLSGSNGRDEAAALLICADISAMFGDALGRASGAYRPRPF